MLVVLWEWYLAGKYLLIPKHFRRILSYNNVDYLQKRKLVKTLPLSMLVVEVLVVQLVQNHCICDVQLLPTVACMVSGCTLAIAYVGYMCATKPDIS